MKMNRKKRRDLERGYEVNKAIIALAYFIEAGIISASVFATYQFANRYVADDKLLWAMAITGGVAVAISETGRMVLAKSVRTQRGFWPKFAAFAGLALMCAITAKSMSQVMEQVYSPRLRQVQIAADNLKIAQSDMDKLVTSKEAAQAKVDPLKESVDGLDKQITDLNNSVQAIGEAPKAHVEKETYAAMCPVKGKNGKVTSVKCTKTRDKWVTPEYQGKAVIGQIDDARQKRQDAATARDEATAVVTGIDNQIADQKKEVTQLESAKREAVFMSQIHSFTAMVYGKDPVEVTEGEIHWFLRIFVFWTAVAIAVSSSLVMMMAYTRIKPKKRPVAPQPIEIQNPETLQRHMKAMAAEVLREKADNNVIAMHKGEKH